MRPLAALAGELWQLVDEVHAAIAADQDRQAEPALDALERALLEVEEGLGHQARDRIAALSSPCVCGRDRGDHLVAPPHASDPEEEGRALGPCEGFVPEARVTERVLCGAGDTEPPPPPAAEAS